MADYKILQNIDLAQNEIKEVSKISNNRDDKKNKGLTIQTENESILITSGKTNASKSTYTENSIVSKADTIRFESLGYSNTDETKSFPHIELTSNSDNKSILIEGKTIDISSKGGEDTINLSGSELNVKSATTEITSKDIKVQHKETVLKDDESKEEDILVLEISNKSDSKLIKVPTTTVVDINSTTIGIGDTDNNSITTISGSELNVGTTNTNITSISTLSGTTTLQSSKPIPENTLKVDTTSTSITGEQVDINPKTVNIGTATNTDKSVVSVVTTDITIGNNAGGTTKLTSETTSITSPKLSVSSGTVEFTGSNISINNTKDDKGKETSSVSLISNVDTSVVGKAFSVKNGNNDILKADTTSVSLAGDSTTIISKEVFIGTDTTTGITIGNNAGGTTELTSETTKITSPTVEIGTEITTTSLNIGNGSVSTINLSGNSNSDLSITSDTTTSTVKAKNLNFTENLVGNGIKIYWDANLSSLVFAKE